MNRKDSLAAGYVDRPILGPTRCWGCGENKYKQTVATEHCDACGLHFDYWDGKSNATYDQAKARHQAAEKERQEREEERELHCRCGFNQWCNLCTTCT